MDLPNTTTTPFAPSHTRDLFAPRSFRRLVEHVHERLVRLSDDGITFDAVAGCGQSGIVMCSALSYMSGIPMIAVRKSEERMRGSTRRANGALFCGRYVFVDDQIHSGFTVQSSVATIYDAELDEMKFTSSYRTGSTSHLVAVLLYNDYHFTERFSFTRPDDKDMISVPVIRTSLKFGE